MRIQSINITNFLGIERVEAQLRAPVALFCGANGAGKSSVRDAVDLALTANLGRVGLKKEAPALIREGADLAVVELADADGDEWRVTINRRGTINDSKKGRDTPPALPYVLDGQRFGRMSATDRRAFLFGLMGVGIETADIKARLVAKGCDAAKVDRVAPLLRSGFDAAHDEAKARATEAKGAWRAAAGEAYGPEKAATWRAKVPKYDAAALKALGVDIEHADVAMGQWQEQIGKLAAEEQRRAALRAKLPALQEHAAKLPRLEVKLGLDRDGLAVAEAALQAAQQRAGAAPRVGLVHELAWALDNMIFFGDPLNPEKDANDARIVAALSAYEAEHGKVHRDADQAGDPEAQARLPALREQLALMQRAVANSQRDVTAAEAAHAEAKGIAAELDEVFDGAALADARDQVERIRAERAAKVAEAEKLRSVKALADAANEKTEQAAKHHADVAAWDALAKALSPNGIPADLLAEALGPINDRLAQSAADTAWPVVTIAADMSITYGAGRPYALCSESERWRADAMLAEAIAHASGTRLLVLDRMDVLDLPARADLLGWLGVLAETGEIDTALVFATLKAPPQGLGPDVSVHWIEAGVFAGEPVAEAA